MLKQEIVPVFVMGARRTGTTAFQQLLCSSPDPHPFVGEFQILTQLLQAFAWGHGDTDPDGSLLLSRSATLQHFSGHDGQGPRVGSDSDAGATTCCNLQESGTIPVRYRIGRDFSPCAFCGDDPGSAGPGCVPSSPWSTAKLRPGCAKALAPPRKSSRPSFVAYLRPLLKLQRKEPERVRFRPLRGSDRRADGDHESSVQFFGHFLRRDQLRFRMGLRPGQFAGNAKSPVVE